MRLSKRLAISALWNQIHARLQEINERQWPDHEPQQLSEEKQHEIDDIQQESQLDEHGAGQDETQNKYLHSVPLQYPHVPSFVDLGVHQAVQGQEEGE